MTSFVLRHLLESTFVALVLGAVACCLRRGAAARYAVWLMAVAKFAVPTVLLAKTGQEIASFLPATPWMSIAAYRISVLLAMIQGRLPNDFDARFAVVWICGSLLLLARWAWRLRSNCAVMTPATDAEKAALVRVRWRLRFGGAVRLLRSDAMSEPALRGIWRPVITLPAGLSERLTSAEFDAVLLHELAHARRLDNLTAALAHFFKCVFWFHPLLWLAEWRLNLERECACDETVLACGTTPAVYMAGILNVCRFHLFEAMPGVSAMTAASLKTRLDAISRERRPPGLLYVPWLLVAALTIFMSLLPMAGGYCQQCSQGGLSDRSVGCKAGAACAPATVVSLP